MGHLRGDNIPAQRDPWLAATRGRITIHEGFARVHFEGTRHVNNLRVGDRVRVIEAKAPRYGETGRITEPVLDIRKWRWVVTFGDKICWAYATKELLVVHDSPFQKDLRDYIDSELGQ